MTTRKRLGIIAGAGVIAALLVGCATPGPTHVYVLERESPTAIHDVGPAGQVDVPSFVEETEKVIGFAYDPYTDHLFLRLSPGRAIRVVDRPGRAIKREFELPAEGLENPHLGDLAIRPRDGHLFVGHSRDLAIIEYTRFGKYVRTIPLEKLMGSPGALAYDSVRDRFLVLTLVIPRGKRAFLYFYDTKGRQLGEIPMPTGVRWDTLGYDAEKREVYALATPHSSTPATVSVFNEEGKLLRNLAIPAAFVDVGPRSFLRVF